MLLTKWRVYQLSASRSPWHSDTLFGCLCWALVHLEGEDALVKMLSACREGHPPFVVSDGFPAGFLPLPSGGEFSVTPEMSANKKDRDSAMTALKPIKRLEYLPEAVFTRVLQGEIVRLDEKMETPARKKDMIVHNSVDRATGSTLEQALYRSSYLWDGELDVYTRIQDSWLPLVKRCFELVGVRGYGGGASRGLGAFTVEQIDLPSNLEARTPNGFITLSRCTPTIDMPTRCQYRLDIKYGRLGQERASAKNPFKLPVAMLCPGAVFWGSPPVDGWCGELVSGVSLAEEFQDVVQCGIAITLPSNIRPPKFEDEYAGIARG